MILAALTARFLKAGTPTPKINLTSQVWAEHAKRYPESDERKQKFRRIQQAYIDGGHSAFHRREQLKNGLK